MVSLTLSPPKGFRPPLRILHRCGPGRAMAWDCLRRAPGRSLPSPFVVTHCFLGTPSRVGGTDVLRGPGRQSVVGRLLRSPLQPHHEEVVHPAAYQPGMRSRLGVESWEFGDFWGLGVESWESRKSSKILSTPNSLVKSYFFKKLKIKLFINCRML